MSIAVTGASGQLGVLVVHELVKATAGTDTKIVALVRNPAKVSFEGAEVRTFDYNNVDVSALAGVKNLLLISSNSFEPPGRFHQHKVVIDAAMQAGVSRIFYTSLVNAGSCGLLLAHDHKSTEEYLEQSGVAYTSLRNGWYFENIDLKQAAATGVILGSVHGAKFHPATRFDFAQATASALLKAQRGESVKKIYELVGSTGITLEELAAEASKASGKQIASIDLPENVFAEKLASFGVPEMFAKVLAQMYEGASKGALSAEGKDLEELIGHPSQDWQEYVKSVFAA